MTAVPKQPRKKNTVANKLTPGKNGHQQQSHSSFAQTWVEDREGIVRFWLSLGNESRKKMLVIEKEDLLQRMKDQSRQTLCHCEACARRGYSTYIYTSILCKHKF